MRELFEDPVDYIAAAIVVGFLLYIFIDLL
jgi:hypothetical protein